MLIVRGGQLESKPRRYALLGQTGKHARRLFFVACSILTCSHCRRETAAAFVECARTKKIAVVFTCGALFSCIDRPKCTHKRCFCSPECLNGFPSCECVASEAQIIHTLHPPPHPPTQSSHRELRMWQQDESGGSC